MRNRPDSRARLAGVTPARQPRQQDDDEPAHDDGWGWPTSTAHPRGLPDRSSRGWVPDGDLWAPSAVGHFIDEPARTTLDRWTSRGVDRRWLDPTEQPAPGPRHQRSPEPIEPPPEFIEEFEPAEERAGPPHKPSERPDPGGGGPEQQTDSVEAHRAKRVRYSPQHAWGRLAQRWVPEPLREARVDPGRRGALLLTVVAAVAALVAAVGVWRDQPTPVPVQSVSLAQVSDASATSGGPAPTGRTTNSLRPATATKKQPGSDGTAGGTAVGGTPVGGAAAGDAAGGSNPTTEGAELLVVSVTGAVRHPGLVRLAPGSRVADAIAKAGGTTPAADLTGLNLAARLTDGASVVVSDRLTGAGSSVSGPAGGAGGSTSTRTTTPAGKVDLNTADVASLDALPGVGPVTAAAIVAWREKNGRYTSVEQLQEIQGIGPAKYAALAALVTV